MKYPFVEEEKNGKRIRTFSPSYDADELAWHRDRQDRRVTVLQSNRWYFQLDEELPVEMKQGDVLSIPKESWHRIARSGIGDLILEIEETD